VIRRPLAERLLVAAGRHPRRVFVGMAIVVGLALLAATRLRFDPDVLHLLPKRNEAVATYRRMLEEFGTADTFLAAIRVREGAPVDPYLVYADELAARMSATGLFHSVEHRLAEPEEVLREFLPRAVSFLDAAERERLAAQLTDEAVHRRVQELRRTLETPQALAVKDLLKLDPLGVSTVFLDRLAAGRGPIAVDWTSGRYLSRDHRLVLVLGRPVRPPQDLSFNHELLDRVQAEAASLRSRWGEMLEGLDLPPPEVVWGGRYVIALDDESLIWRDVTLNAATSIAGVLGLFWLAYRRTSLLALVFSPLFCGLAITFGFASLAVGVLASTTAGVTALLVGLGDDFVIVLYGRYVAERWRGASIEDSMRAMGGGTVRGVILGAMTTSATFCAFLITDFTGLYQMGLIVGIGILFCLLAVLFLVPAMIGWSEEHHRKRESTPRLHIFAFGVEKLTGLAMRHPRKTLGVAVVLTVLAVAVAPRLRFDDSVEALRPAGNRGILAREEVARHFGSGFDHLSLMVEAPTLEEVLALADRAAAGARELVASGRLGGWDAVTSILPRPASQREALDWLAAARADGRMDPERIRRAFAAAAESEGLRLEPFEPGLALLERALEPPGPVTLETVLSLPQGRTLVDRYLRQTPEGWKSVVRLYNLPGRPKREVPEAAIDLARSLGPDATLTGMNVLSKGLRAEIWRDAFGSAGIGLVLVILLLWADFRSLRTALLALVPLLVGIAWMVGLMVALDLHLNFMNIFVLTMILGIGAHYGIHVIHRFVEERETPGGDVQEAVEETARGVLLAALTTIVGFGSLATSHYPGLVSMGLVSIVGTLSTCLVAVAVVPAWLAWRNPGPASASTPAHPLG
jgi:predicted RND superfamily exporter protein